MPPPRPPHVPLSRVDAALEDDPIDAACILDGAPRARVSSWAESADLSATHWTWDCTAGRFRWYFAVDESVVIVEGGVTVQVDGADPVELQVGDAAYFPAGNWSTWTVPHYVRKQAVIRVPVPRSLRYVVNGFGRRRYRLRDTTPPGPS